MCLCACVPAGLSVCVWACVCACARVRALPFACPFLRVCGRDTGEPHWATKARASCSSAWGLSRTFEAPPHPNCTNCSTHSGAWALCEIHFLTTRCALFQNEMAATVLCRAATLGNILAAILVFAGGPRSGMLAPTSWSCSGGGHSNSVPTRPEGRTHISRQTSCLRHARKICCSASGTGPPQEMKRQAQSAKS